MIPLHLYIGGGLLAAVAALGWLASSQHDKLVLCRQALKDQAVELGKLGELETLKAQLKAAAEREAALREVQQKNEAALAAVKQKERRLRSTVAALEKERSKDVTVDVPLPQSLIDRLRSLEADFGAPTG